VKEVKLQTLRGELESMRMKETEGVVEYITRVETVANQLGRNKEALPDNCVVEKISRLLIDDFDNVVCTIEEYKDLYTLTVVQLVGLFRHTSNEKRRERWSHLNMHSNQKQQLQRRKHVTLKTLEVEEEVEEVKEMVVVVEVEEDMKKREVNLANKIGMNEEVDGEEVDRAP